MKKSGPLLVLRRPDLSFMHMLHAFKKPPRKHRNPNAANRAEPRSRIASAAISFFVLSVQLLFAAHLVFHGFEAAAVLAAASFLLWTAGRRWTGVLSFLIMIESIEWIRTLVFFAFERLHSDRSIMPGAAIIFTCAAASSAAALAAWRKSREKDSMKTVSSNSRTNIQPAFTNENDTHSHNLK